jgi:hypothetical protein
MVLGVSGLITTSVLAGCGGSGAPAAAKTVRTTATVDVPQPYTVTPAVTVTVTAPPPGPKTAFAGDGTFIVGTDVQPGTYRSATPDSGNCYWALLSNLSGTGETGGIIANNNSAGPSVVTITSGDMAITVTGCAPWTQVG